ncbi:type 4a pilus biogenesis protein PilO [Paenibacillus silvisoli]|uniref:type 4a pilus biogenesis protein PilO n=1 Tax=Paenibacillus silvisoli TaxID=3110539 RepID=UPI002803D5FB|nr:type 4a pilus biogenesis protein PilO [Paenibacillus silvisoli]
MQQLSKNRSAAVLLIALLFLILFAVYTYILQPTNSKITDQQTEIERLDSQFKLLSTKLAEKKQASDDLSKESVQKALPLWDNTEQLLLDLQTIESTTGAETLTATFTPDASDAQSGNAGDEGTAASENSQSDSPYGPNVKQLKVASVIKGSYSSILQYVEELQKLSRLITIDSFDVAKPSGNDTNKPLSANIVYTAYFDPSYKSLVTQVIQPFNE